MFVKAVRWKGLRGIWREGFKKRYLLSLEWKRVGVTDNDSGDDGTYAYTIRLRRVRKRMIRIRLME